MVRIRANDEREIPLFLLPRIIAEQVLKTGDRIYRISVKRTHWHHYNVSVRTKALPRELAPGCCGAILPGPQKAGTCGIATGSGGGGSV
ncbi:hypothetical protein [Methanoregula sp.]|uniref:hypothetical protein n=1 Tax=Methanoregula sp. TaxID=2052170 RepID=UPI002371374B|nr:hypothetical protein [Methanoregula sp.]MDD1687847.1 hypothetical protein [Methanoregula sp.]